MEATLPAMRNPLSMMPITQDKVNPCALAHRPRVLLVDDDESYVELWCMAGPYLGLDIVGFTDPRVAHYVFARAAHPFDHFDLVITDYEMGHLDGLELARRLLQIRPGTPIILATGCIELSHLDADRAGCVGVLGKPFTSTELRTAVELALKGALRSPVTGGES